MNTQNPPLTTEIEVWDTPLRIFKWSFAFLFALAYITEDEIETLHFFAGFTLAGLVVFRLIWGIIGNRYARWSQFLTGKQAIQTYLGELLSPHPKRYLGHNPAGGWMIVFLIIGVSLTALSGMALIATDGLGPLSHTFLANFDEDAFEEIHELFANGTLLLVLVHIAGVFVSSVLHKENLVRAMITGRKNTETH